VQSGQAIREKNPPSGQGSLQSHLKIFSAAAGAVCCVVFTSRWFVPQSTLFTRSAAELFLAKLTLVKFLLSSMVFSRRVSAV
jgi:hypothetical protein